MTQETVQVDGREKTAPAARTGFATYLELFRYPRSAVLILAAFAARLPSVMVPIGLVLFVGSERTSFGNGALLAGAYSIGGAVGAPVVGRLLDRRSPRVVILATGALGAALLIAFSFALRGSSILLLIPFAVVVGAVQPPISPAYRVAIRSCFADMERRRSGYAFDSLSVEGVYVIGPLILSAFVGKGEIFLLFCTGMLLLISSAVMAATLPDAASVVAEEVQPQARKTFAFLRGPILRVLMVSVTIGLTFGIIDASMSGIAVLVLEDKSRVGYLFATTAIASVIGGLCYGAIARKPDDLGRVRLLLPVFAVLLGLVAVILALQMTSLTLLVVLLFGAGLTIAPIMIGTANLIDRFSPAGRTSEGQAWNGTSTVAGLALGTVLAGQLLDLHGTGSAMAAGALVVVCGAVAAFSIRPGKA